MSQVKLECQGLPCPQPVLKCKSAIEADSPQQITAFVDNEAAKENVSRFLSTQGYEATVEKQGDDFVVTGVKKNAHTVDCEVCEIMSDAEITSIGNQKTLVFIDTEVMGAGDDVLGAKLMYNFLLTLKELGPELWRIIMVNGGVKLAVSDNECMEVLKNLEKDGVSILVCGTCLEFFGLTSKYGVGQITNMLDVVTSLQLASKTIHV